MRKIFVCDGSCEMFVCCYSARKAFLFASHLKQTAFVPNQDGAKLGQRMVAAVGQRYEGNLSRAFHERRVIDSTCMTCRKKSRWEERQVA